MLDRLERADRPAELDPLPGVPHGQVQRALRHPYLERGRQQRAGAPEPRRVLRARQALAVRGANRDGGDRREGIERDWLSLLRRSLERHAVDAAVVEDEQVGHGARVLHQGDWVTAVHQAHHGFPVRGAGNQAGRQEGGGDRPWYQGAAQFLEDDHGVGQAQAHTAVVRRQGHPEDAEAGQGLPGPVVEGLAVRGGAQPFRGPRIGEVRPQHGPHVALLGGEHQVHLGSFGRPSARSARMFRWT